MSRWDSERIQVLDALLADYSVKGLPDIIGYVISAIAGAAIVLILFKLCT